MLFLTIVEGGYQASLALSLDLPRHLPSGAFSFDLRPVAWLLFALVMLIAMTFRLRRIQDRNRAVEQEMTAARTVQQLLIPDEMPSIPACKLRARTPLRKKLAVIFSDYSHRREGINEGIESNNELKSFRMSRDGCLGGQKPKCLKIIYLVFAVHCNSNHSHPSIRIPLWDFAVSGTDAHVSSDVLSAAC